MNRAAGSCAGNSVRRIVSRRYRGWWLAAYWGRPKIGWRIGFEPYCAFIDAGLFNAHIMRTDFNA